MTRPAFASAILGAMRNLAALSFLLVASCADPTPGTSPPPSASATLATPDALTTAYDAYLAGDLARMTVSLRQVLVATPLDADVRDNAFALLEAAYERGEGTLPADWALPPGLVHLDVGQVLVAAPGGESRVVYYMTGRVDDPTRLLGLTLTHDGVVLLDKATGQGHFGKVKLEEDGRYTFSLDIDGTAPLAPGVYELRLTLAGTAPVDGWVIVTDLGGNDGLRQELRPRLRTPRPDEVVSGNPTLAFDEFFSPSYRRFERRGLWIGVSQHDSQFLWEYWTDKPTAGPIVLGRDPRGTPAPTTFAPGRYHIGIQWMEKRRFGPVEVGRGARTGEPFQVE